MDAKYQKVDLNKIVSYSKILSSDEQSMLYDVLNKYELFLDGTLGTWKTKPVNIELQPGAKTYHLKTYPVRRAHEAVLHKEVVTHSDYQRATV